MLLGGTVGAQSILLLAAPFLTRLYSPNDFGLLAVYGGLLAIISVITSLSYELAIPLPKDDGVAANLVMLCLLLVAIISILTGAVIFIFYEPILKMIGEPAMANYLWLLPLGLFLTGLYKTFNYWNIRTKNFQCIAKTKLKQSVTTLAIQILGYKFGATSLLLGQIAGQSIGTHSLAISSLKNKGFNQLSLSQLKCVMSRYKEFPLFSSWSGVINATGHQLPPIIFAMFFSVGAAGLYVLAHRLLAMPANLIGSSLAQVFLSHGVDRRREGGLALAYTKLQNTLIQISLAPTLLVILFGPTLFSVIFGEEWYQAGIFAQWLAGSVFFGFVVSPLSQIFTILEKEKTGLFLQSFLFLSRLTGIVTGVILDNLLHSIILYSVGGSLGYVGYIYYGAKVTGCNMRKISASFVVGFFNSIAVLTPFVVGYSLGIFWVTAILGVSSFVLYILQLRTAFKTLPG